MSYDDDPPRRRRENLMQQRLRKARGEDVDDDLDAYDAGYEEDDPPLIRFGGGGGGGYRRPRPRSTRGGGCGSNLLSLTLGGLIVLLIGIFFYNQTFGRLGAMLPSVPNISTIIITPTPQVITGAAVIQRVQQLSRLETASYTIERVIDVSQGSNIPIVGDFLAGDEILLIAHGTVVAGVDLSNLPPDAATVSPDGSTITLRLPPVQIFDTSLDAQKTRVYSRERGLFAPENKDLETQARQIAEDQILQAACEDGIMQKATDAARDSITQFLSLAEFAQVVVVTAEPSPCGGSAAPTP